MGKRRKSKKKAGSNKALIIIVAILFWPITLLVLLWKNEKISTKSKAISTAVALAVISLIGAFGGNNEEPAERSIPGNIVEQTVAVTTEPTTAATTTEATTTTKATTKATTVTTKTTTATNPPETEPETPAPTPAPVRERVYWLNTDSGKYHYENCRTIKDGTLEDYWQSTTDLDWLKANYSACGVCKPR